MNRGKKEGPVGGGGERKGGEGNIRGKESGGGGCLW